jgi:GNAT superfamily N-acetyltransferase
LNITTLEWALALNNFMGVKKRSHSHDTRNNFGPKEMLLSDKFVKMVIREARIEDIQQIQRVRNSVIENILSDPGLVTDKDCEEFITRSGKGWVCEMDKRIVGFAIADLEGNNIWALFMDPEFEGMGIGRALHDIMLDWYFARTKEKVWLGTEFNTRAEKFYRKAGWTEAGTHGTREIRFEMTYGDWISRRSR